MRIQDKDLLEVLRCPVSFTNVRLSDGYILSECDDQYATVDGKPILVDFENSILDKESILLSAAKSLVKRKKSSKLKKIKELLFHRSAAKIAERNAKNFLDHLSTNSNPKKVLVIGGGTQGIGTKLLYEHGEIELISLDIYNSESVDLIADAHNIPFHSESIDGVWVQYVIEHVLDPWTVVEEIHRVLKPSGVVYSETPFLQQVHEGRYDFVRFTHSGHRWLFKKFIEIDSGIAMGAGLQVLWSIDYAMRGLFRSEKIGKFFKVAFFWIRVLDKIIPKSFQYDMSSSFFFLGEKTKKAMSYAEILNYYRGTDKI